MNRFSGNAVAALVMCFSLGCDDRSNPMTVTIVLSDRQAEPITLLHVAGGTPPSRVADGLEIVVPPGGVASYDLSGWPRFFKLRTRFRDGEPIEANFADPKASFYVSAMTVDDHRNTRFNLVRKP